MSAANLSKSSEAWVDLGPKVGTKAYHRHHFLAFTIGLEPYKYLTTFS